jgi:hypothetical protein
MQANNSCLTISNKPNQIPDTMKKTFAFFFLFSMSLISYAQNIEPSTSVVQNSPVFLQNSAVALFEVPNNWSNTTTGKKHKKSNGQLMGIGVTLLGSAIFVVGNGIYKNAQDELDLVALFGEADQMNMATSGFYLAGIGLLCTTVGIVMIATPTRPKTAPQQDALAREHFSFNIKGNGVSLDTSFDKS